MPYLCSDQVFFSFSLFVGSFSRVGIDMPTIEVRYESLNIEADAYVGNRGPPTILNSMLNVLEVGLEFFNICPFWV